MAVALTVLLSSDGRGFNLNVTASGYTTFTITRRRTGTTEATIVRGSNAAELSGIGEANVLDIEVPQNTPLQYQATVSNTTTSEQSAWIDADKLVQFGSSVIYNLASSVMPVKVRVNQWEKLNHDYDTELVWVDGRDDPIAVTGIRHKPSSTMTLLFLTNVEYEAILTAVGSGITCFAPKWPERAGIPSGLVYLSVLRIGETRLSMKKEDPARYLDLEVQEILPPPADYLPVNARTWDEVIAWGLTNDALSQFTNDQLAGYT